MKKDNTAIVLDSIIEGIFEKKGQEVVQVDLRKLETRIADYFIICQASSTTLVDSLCESVEDKVREIAKEKPLHVEGLDNCFWVLLDYGNVVVHIFLEEYRRFYNLESLWADAIITKIVDEPKPNKEKK